MSIDPRDTEVRRAERGGGVEIGSGIGETAGADTVVTGSVASETVLTETVVTESSRLSLLWRSPS